MSTSANDHGTMRLKTLVVDDDCFVSAGLSAMLESLGYDVLACAGSGAEGIELTAALHPDLVLMDIKMTDMDGLTASERILEQHPVPIIIVTAVSDPEMVRRADQIGVAGYLVKPFLMKELTPAVTMALSRFRQLQALKREVGSLKESIRSRKIIEKAKGLLMERERLTEEQAYTRIQHMSRNRNISMVKLAEAIILTDSLGSEKRPQTAYRDGRRFDS